MEDYRHISDGHLTECPSCKKDLSRDYSEEVPSVIADWPAGYNISINSHYKNKKDLLDQMKRQGYLPQQNSGGVTRSTGGLYGDEEFKPPEPQEEVEV